MHHITKHYGIPKTVANNREFIEIEQYRVFFREQSTGLLLSLLAVIAVVGFITANAQISLWILCAVILVDFYLVGII